jgi:hypothetical protein
VLSESVIAAKYKKFFMVNQSSRGISFYIVAHADDWQLFMQPNVYRDLINVNLKVIFIVTTAGDAGNDETYWRAREEGSKSSIRLCLAPRSSLSEHSQFGNFNEHRVYYSVINNTTSYFLRLPDGNLDSKGFEKYHFESLPKLKDGQIAKITAVDQSTTYHGWEDLCTTIKAIILYESAEVGDVTLNYLNPDNVANPDDHADHRATGQAIQQISSAGTSIQKLFVGYSVNNTENNLTENHLFWKAGMFAAYEKTVFDLSGYSTLREGLDIYNRWCLSAAKFITVDPAKQQK